MWSLLWGFSGRLVKGWWGMAEHTKGPWVVDDIFEEGGLDIVLGYGVPGAGSPIPIAFVHGVDEHGGPPKTKAEVRANANLLGAAPELLSALKGLLESVAEARWRPRGEQGPILKDAREKAEAAVRKAESAV